MATGLEKVSFHSNPKEWQCQTMFKLLHNCSHLARYKVMLKSLQARLQQYVNHELPDVQTGFRKGKGTEWRSNGQHPLNHRKSRKIKKKKSTSALLTTPKPLTVWITTNWKILQEIEYQTT